MSRRELTRAEKIQLYRGIIQTIGLIILIMGMAWMIKNFNDRKIMGECIYVKADGSEEHTGLYGNCTWYDAKINNYYDPNEIVLIDPPLQSITE